MKRTILFVVTAFIAFGAVFRVEAKKPEDQEFRRVIVTLKSGEKVEGDLKSGWHADGALLKKENYSFKITKTPDDKESVKYTADEVTCIDYAEKTEENPDGIHWDALDIASPSIGNRYNTIRRLVCLDKVGKNATTYWWKIWTTERVGNINRRILKTVHGVRFHDDPDKVVYTYMLVNTMLMDKLHPGLHEFCKKWFKGPEGKVRKKEAKEDDAWILDMYDAYLEQQAVQ